MAERASWRERSTLVRLTRLVRTRRPRTFTEKVRYKMLRDHRPLLVTFADKAAVRDYVTRVVGAGYLPRLLGLFDDPEGLRTLPLPERYVVKPTHGSGACIVVSPGAPEDARVPPAGSHWGYSHVRPDAVTREELIATAHYWSTQLYGQGPNREWAYGPVPRRVIVEEMLTDERGGIPHDLKLFVFNGRCRYIQIDGGRFGGRTQDFFDVEWRHLPMSGGPPFADPEPPRPERLGELIAVAEALARETDFVRVDLYHLPDRVVVGELTSYPAGGDSPFHPEHFDAEFGRHWTVPRRYH